MITHPAKKVAKKKLIGFTAAALKELQRRTQENHHTQTQVLHDALLGRDRRFNPHVESGIRAYQKLYDCTRHEAIEGLVSEALVRQASKRTGE